MKCKIFMEIKKDKKINGLLFAYINKKENVK